MLVLFYWLKYADTNIKTWTQNQSHISFPSSVVPQTDDNSGPLVRSKVRMKLELRRRRITPQNANDDGVVGLGRGRPRVEPGIGGRGADDKRFVASLFRLGFVGSGTNDNLDKSLFHLWDFYI